MKKINYTLLIFVFTLCSCSENNDGNTSLESNITFNFSHTWDNTLINNTDFNSIKFTNENGEQLSITKLRYLISKIRFTSSKNEIIEVSSYNLIDVTNNATLSFSPNTKIPNGEYNNVSFIFGFDNEDNYTKNYPDLNSASWNVPDVLGGGYHYMQLEGKFLDTSTTETGYAYHAIRAVDNNGSSQQFQDTFFTVNLGSVTLSRDTLFNIEMNVSQWFKAPNTWNLNVLNSMLMPNFNAQVMMFENGQNVFQLKSVSN